MKLRPWRYHTWQHILDPQACLERARPVQRARELLKQGFWIACVDEELLIPAQERTRMPDPAVPGHSVHISSRYERQGALDLFGGLRVADGQVNEQCHLRKRFVDFPAFLLEVIIPKALQRGVHALALILDNSTAHAPKQLDRYLQDRTKSHG